MNTTPYRPKSPDVLVGIADTGSLLIVTFIGGEKDFENCHEAEDFCRHHGISMGSMERGNPIGLLHGEGHYISKWTNMTMAEQRSCHGTMTADAQGFRNGDITIRINKP